MSASSFSTGKRAALWRRAALEFAIRPADDLALISEQHARYRHDRMTSPATLPAVRCVQNRNRRGVMEKFSDSDFRPAPQQIVVNASELHDRGIVRLGRINALDGGVQIEQQRALAIVAHHALNPEE